MGVFDHVRGMLDYVSSCVALISLCGSYDSLLIVCVYSSGVCRP